MGLIGAISYIKDIKPEWTHKVLSLLRKLDPELDNDQAMQQLTKLRDFHKQLQGVQLYKSGNGYQKVHVRELLIAAPSVSDLFSIKDSFSFLRGK